MSKFLHGSFKETVDIYENDEPYFHCLTSESNNEAVLFLNRVECVKTATDVTLSFFGQEIGGHVIGQDVLEQLRVVLAHFGDVAQLFDGLLLPEKVETRSDFHQPRVVADDVEEEEDEDQHGRFLHLVRTTRTLHVTKSFSRFIITHFTVQGTHFHGRHGILFVKVSSDSLVKAYNASPPGRGETESLAQLFHFSRLDCRID